jgi:hypothetical protein
MDLVSQVFAVAGLDPDSMTDDGKEAALDALSEQSVLDLDRIDGEMFKASGDLMDRCHAFARTHGLDA